MKKSIIGILCCAAFLCCMLTGCGFSNDTSAPTSNLTVIAAKQANQPAPDIDLIKEDIFQTASSYGQVSIIRLDGAPALVKTLSVKQKDGFYTAGQLDSRASNQAAQIQTSIEGIISEVPECNLLNALCLAGRCVDRAEGETNTLEVFSNGLNTVAPLDMTVTVLHNLDVEDIVQQLNDQKALPDLSNYDSVKIYQLGETEPPQSPLTQKDIAALEDLWTAILTAGGLDESKIEFVDTPSTDNGDDAALKETLPSISTVTVIQDENTITASAEGAESGINITLTENRVSFIPNSCDLTDTDAARIALQPTANTLVANPDIHILIIGQTATVGDAEFCQELSLQRAQRVSQELTNLGVTGSQMQCIGLGYEPSPLHIKDISADGVLLEDQAQQNRVVHIIDASTELAQQILAQYAT